MLLTMMVMMSADLESIDRLIPQTPSPSKNTLWALPNDKTAERQTEKKKKDKKTERQKDKMTERQKDKMTERQKDSKKYKNTKITKRQNDRKTGEKDPFWPLSVIMAFLKMMCLLLT